MPDAKAPRDIFAETMSDGRKVLVPYLAEMLKRGKISEVDAKDERRRFWLRAMTEEQEAQLWQQAMLQRGLTPETLTPEQATDIGLGIAKQVYQARFDMMEKEGRDTPSAQATWAWKHAQMGPPEEKPVEGATDGTTVRAADQPLYQGPADQGQGSAVVPQALGQPPSPQVEAAAGGAGSVR